MHKPLFKTKIIDRGDVSQKDCVTITTCVDMVVGVGETTQVTSDQEPFRMQRFRLDQHIFSDVQDVCVCGVC